MTADTEFPTRDTGNILIFDHQASAGHGFALRRVGVFHFPKLFPCLRIKGDNLPIQGVHNDLPLDVIQTTMHHITAGHGHSLRILLRGVAPLDGIWLFREVKGIDMIREGRMDKHGGTNNQWGAFVPAERPGRKRPGDLEVFDVIDGNLIELAIASSRIVLPLHDPLARVFLELEQFVVRIG
jgi:hypothetical protein